MKKCLLGLFLILFVLSSLVSQVYKDPNAPVEQRVEDLLGRMTLDEKIGQMTQANTTDATTSQISQYFLGSVLSGGGANPSDNTWAGWAGRYDQLQQAALNTRLGIPLIYGVDAVHGHNSVKNAVVFPHNIGLGAANDPVLMEEIGSITAREVAATGIDWTFAPCVTVPRDIRWGRTYEGFAEDPQIHNNITAALVRGLQGPIRYMQDDKIVACAKHWIADGGTSWGSGAFNRINMGNAQISESELRSIHMPPYERALEAGIGTFMVSFSSWNGTRCTGSEYLMTTLLKGELGFDGFIVSDWNSIRDLGGSYRTQIKTSVNAGLDMAMAPYEEDWQPFISDLRDLVNSNEVSMSRIDDAVRRILRIKFQAGLFENPLTDRSYGSTVGTIAHRNTAREAVRKSMVLLKNDGLLPLSKGSNIFVGGDSADSLIKQCGGWTIGWQDMGSNSATSGNTILDGIEMINGGNVDYNRDGYGAQGHDFAIVVVGEDAYAESDGDDSDLSLSLSDKNVINQVRSAGIPYMIVLVSGRPMIVTDEINNANAFVAAWLPGTEGDGVAEVLFNDYDFTGKLPFSWPSSMSQIPINVGDSNYNPLYEFGYGLSYGTGPTNPPLDNLGDVNNDGSISIVDALMVAQYYVGLISNINTGNADTNCDGSISIVDALIIAQYYVGLLIRFPGC